MSKIDVAERERAIIQTLQRAGTDGASVKDIYESVTTALDDHITRAAYYKVLDRMVIAGRIELLRDEAERGRIYGITPTLQAANPLTLDDVYAMLPLLGSSEALARIVDAQDYYEENRQTVIRRAAEALCAEDPVELFHRMILDKAELVQADQAILAHRDPTGQAEIADAHARARLEIDYRLLEHIVYRGLSLTHQAIHLPGIHRVEMGKPIKYDSDKLRDELSRRVFGKTFIREVDVSTNRATQERAELIVSGSDGSMHAGALALRSAGTFVEDSTDIISFNNSAAYVRLSPRRAAAERRPHMVYSAPLTRQTLDDPTYKGMVLAQRLFPDLTESAYEHMARCATDVVQFRVDEDVFIGKAYDLLPPNAQIPKPQVHFRDGTVTPQEREFSHYYRPDAYGEMVREGIRRERTILERIIMSGERGPIFAGAVKSTQMRIFSTLLNWYIAQGSRTLPEGPIEPNWNVARAAAISDNEAMTMLLAALPSRANEGKFYVSCAVVREFPSLTEFYDYDLRSETWLDFFERKKAKAIEENQQYSGTLPYHATVDLVDDDFVFMCQRADYASFYIGHTGGDPPPMIPRYEFLTSLREKDQQGAVLLVDKTVRRMVDALDAASIAQDRDHNFLTGKTLVKLLPYPVQQAHEYCKTMGRKLEAELKSSVVSKLIELKRLRADSGNVVVRPISIRRYLERFAQAKERLSDDQNDDVR